MEYQYTLFDGETYDHALDNIRLSTQLCRVRDLMLDGQWWSLKELSAVIEGSEAGISARIRDLRKERFGGFIINKRRRTTGTWEYRMDLNQ